LLLSCATCLFNKSRQTTETKVKTHFGRTKKTDRANEDDAEENAGLHQSYFNLQEAAIKSETHQSRQIVKNFGTKTATKTAKKTK